jgi:hypothetical protein
MVRTLSNIYLILDEGLIFKNVPLLHYSQKITLFYSQIN